LQQNSSGILFDFDGADRDVSEEQVPEDSASRSGEEVQGFDFGMRFHIGVFHAESLGESAPGGIHFFPARPVLVVCPEAIEAKDTMSC
jgi:hypothetical protein